MLEDKFLSREISGTKRLSDKENSSQERIRCLWDSTKFFWRKSLFTCDFCTKITRLFPLFLAEYRTLALILLLSIFSALLAPLAPLPLKFLVDVALADDPQAIVATLPFGSTQWSKSPETLIAIVGIASIVLFTISITIGSWVNWLWSKAGQGMTYKMAQTTFELACKHNPLFHSRYTTGDLISRTATDSYSVFVVAQSLLVGPPAAIATILFTAIIAWHLDPLLTLLCVVAIPSVIFIARYFGDKLRNRSRSEREAKSDLVSFVHQVLTAIPVVQAFDKALTNRAVFRRITDRAVKQASRSVLLGSLYTFLNGFTLTFSAALVLFVGSMRVLDNQLSLGSLLVFLNYAHSMQRVTDTLVANYASLKSAEAGLDRLLDIVGVPPDVKDHDNAKTLETSFTTGNRVIEFDRVSFGYRPEELVINNVSFVVNVGETLALVGRSGSGKSTIASLLLRFYDPQSGSIKIADENIRDVRLDSLRRSISVVLQEPLLLPLSIAENIAFGHPEASRSQIIEAARDANADDFIRKLPEGYDTVLSERGSTLSGGQRQRLSIARALLKNAPVLLLDEPTSALDVNTESSLLEALERLRYGRTTLVIAHRLSTIRNADRIAVLEHGNLVELGTHDELLAKREAYFSIYHAGNKSNTTLEHDIHVV